MIPCASKNGNFGRRLFLPKFVSFEALGQPEAYLPPKAGGSNHSQISQASRAVAGIINSELTPRQRQIIQLYYNQRLNTTQIAELLKINKSTVSRTLARAQSKVYRFLRYYRFR